MNGSFAAIAVLCIALLAVTGLLIYQQIFFARQIKDLVDRLMARSIGEFERAKNPPPPRVVIPKQEEYENFDRITG